ncbi:AAA family ATPase [Gryllotalpicola reticulitermitis]|uniref:AAA family ATPase n=1 Tax=Gryllotalpicola reticulitermitis TaxID=1184153 RepID=A0ABV8Q419_9MICO
MPTAMFDTVLINGSVGTGKTTAAEGVGVALEQLGIPGAVIDVDWLRRSWPAPQDDPFRTALGLENLQSVASNFRRAGAHVLVVATVVETVEELQRSKAALGSRTLLHVRLTADADAVLSRLTRRHTDDEAALRWHARRHPELARVLDRAGFAGELVIDTTDQPATAIAQQIVTALVG